MKPTRRNYISDFDSDEDEKDLVSNAIWIGSRVRGEPIDLGSGYTLRISERDDKVSWGVSFRGKIVGGGSLHKPRNLNGKYAEEIAGFSTRHRGKGLHRKALSAIRGKIGPFYSDDSRTSGNEASWEKIQGVTFDSAMDRWVTNPLLGNDTKVFARHKELRQLQDAIFKKDGRIIPLDELREAIEHAAKSAAHHMRYKDFKVVEGGKQLRANPGPRSSKKLKKSLRFKSFIGPIYRVCGVGVRHADVDGVGGWHNKVYPKLVPKGEIWIEQMHGGPVEERYLVAHEMLEIILMHMRGWKYQKAHNVASKYEHKLRRGGKPFMVFAAYIKKYFPRATLAARNTVLMGLLNAYNGYR